MTSLEGLNAFLEAWEGIFQHLPFKKDNPLLPGAFGTDTSRFLYAKMSRMLETVASKELLWPQLEITIRKLVGVP